MRALNERVIRAMRALAPKGARVAVAVSGGPDSVAMSWLLHDLQQPAGFTLAGLAHFNHRLRGAEADQDEAFCRELAAQLGVPFFAGSGDVAAQARAWKVSTEVAARRLRYEFLERARAEFHAGVVAVGHTRDDQAETFLLRLLRGAGPRGLGGIRAARGRIVRPLLDVGRQELRDWLGWRGIAFRIDPSNADTSIPRNRIRHELLPVLERLSPGAVETIARAAAIADADERYLDDRAIEAALTCVLTEEGSGRRVDLVALRALHPAIARRVLRRALAEVAPGRFFALRHVDALLQAPRGRLDLPGVTGIADAAAGVLRLEPGGRVRGGTAEPNVFRCPLSIPGETLVPECAIALSAEFVNRSGQTTEKGVHEAVYLRPETAAAGLWVRTRRPGDRIRPAGLNGTRKLQDLFVDRKVPRSQRDTVPLVVDGDDRIVWVVGHAVAGEHRALDGTGPESPVLLLKVRHVGESV